MSDERENLLAIVRERHFKLSALHRAHWYAAKRSRRKSEALGIPVVILTAVTGTAIFANLESDGASEGWRIAAGVFALVAAVLAGVQTFLNYPKQADDHRRAAVEWGALRRAFDILGAAPPESTSELRDVVIRLDAKWAEVEPLVPGVSNSVYDSAKEEYDAPLWARSARCAGD